MTTDILQIVFSNIMPYLVPILVLFGGLAFVDRFIDSLKDIFSAQGTKRRSF